MKRIGTYLLTALLLATPAVLAQQDDRGLIQRTLEDNLSGAGRIVTVTGFSGALSSQAQLEELTVADDSGIWLTLRGVTLDWTRSALLRGRVEVAELSAEEILLDRLPSATEGVEASDAEASGFTLPELPVAIKIDTIQAERIILGDALFGTTAELSLTGTLSLEGGEGAAQLDAQRLDGPTGQFTLNAAFQNTTEILTVDLLFEEDRNGIVAQLASLPGRPSVRLATQGSGPLSDFAATLALETDNVERLAGDLTIASVASGRTFQADVAGDIAPLFAPAYQAFFGSSVALQVTGIQESTGLLNIPTIRLQAATLDLDGALRIGADGLPLAIAINGQIADPAGGPVLLPLSGPRTQVDAVTLSVGFDAVTGDTWTGEAQITGLDRPGFAAARAQLSGTGQIKRQPQQAVTATLDFAAEALDFGDPATETAVGERVEGRADINWREEAPLELSALSVTGESYALSGDATATFRDRGLDLSFDAQVQARDLSAFSGIANRALSGAADARISGTAQPVAGTFDVNLSAATTDVTVAQAEADRLLQGDAQLDGRIARSPEGTRIDDLSVASPGVTLRANALFASTDSQIDATGTLRATDVIAPGVSSPLTLDIQADQTGAFWATTAGLVGDGLTAQVQGRIDLSAEVPGFDGTVQADIDDLSPFSSRAGRDLAGGVTATLEGGGRADLARLDISGTITGRDLRIDQPQADRLLAGIATLSGRLAQTAEGLVFEGVVADAPAVSLSADGIWANQASRATAMLTLRDTGVIAEDVPSPLTLELDADQTGEFWDIVADLAGEGVAANIAGRADLSEDVPAFDGTLDTDITNLTPYAALAGRDIAGSVTAKLQGGGRADLERLAVSGTINGTNLRIGQRDIDALLTGQTNITADLTKTGDTVDIRTLNVETGQLSLTAAGALENTGGTLTVDARLADISPFAQGISGPARASGEVTRTSDQNWLIDLDATGPGGARATAAGGLAGDFSTVDLTLGGNAPLTLANRFIAPRTVSGSLAFDLAVNGPPALGSVSGTLRSADARAVAPELGIVLSNIDTNVDLSGGRATLNTTAQVRDGGQISVRGPVTLSEPFQGNLDVSLANVVLVDPELYRTSVSGQIALTGPLTGGAAITGALRLGETQLQVPSGTSGGLAAIPDIAHVNEPAAVRATRARAGLIVSGDTVGASRGRAFPLNITVAADNRIFIRGRGLDAELGGQLRLGGTSNDIVPQGQFDLVRGRLDILGQRLTLTEGRATLQGDFDPFLLLIATTQAEDVTVRIVIEGPASAPEIRFESDPDLPEDEVLARLLFGRGIETLSPLQAAQLASAVATLAGRGGDGIVSRLRQSFGLDDLDVTTGDDGGTAVRAGKYISDNVYTDITVGSEGSSEVTLNLDISPSFTAKGTVDDQGQTGIGLFFERDY